MSKMGFFSDPHVQYVTQVLDEILAGNLQIPRFQRPYMWDWDRRLDLFRSIQLGIPMGAIMIWRTSGEQLQTYRQFGSIRFKEPMPTGPQQYLLDGVQRLSTLLSALTSPELENFPESESLYQVQDGDRVAYYDLEANDFIALKPNEEVRPWYMPLYLLSDSIAMFKFQRDLNGVNVNKWIFTLDSLAKSFREYKIPVIPIVTDDIGLASQTFQRINSSGLQMGEKDMLHALTYSSSFDFSSELDDLRDSLDEIGWGKLDDDLLLKLVKAALNLDVYKSEVDDVSKAIKTQPNILLDLRRSLKASAEFFLKALNMPSPEFVPYSFHIVGVAEAYRIAFKSGLDLPKGIDIWVLLTTYAEYFTGLSGDKVSAQLDSVRRSVEHGVSVDLPPALKNSFVYQSKIKFDFRTARSKVFVGALVRRMNEQIDMLGTDLIRKFGKFAIISGIPRESLSLNNSFLSPGNKFLVDPSMIADFRVKLSGSLSVLLENDDFFAAHGISDEARNYLVAGKMDEFIRVRHLDFSVEEGNYLKFITQGFSI